jgi:anti-sigma B factor antagonist
MPRMSESFQVAGRAGPKTNIYIISVRGAITYSNAPTLQEASGASDATRLILDLSEVPSVDSMAVGALVRILVSCSKSGRKLAVVGPNHRIRNVLQLTGVDALFDIYATIPDAESALDR